MVETGFLPFQESTAQDLAEAAVIPTGTQLFHSLSTQQQEAAVGAEAADLIREGADIKDFVAHSRQEERDDHITQRPVEQVSHTTQEVNQ
jgi:hypothetical protein